MIWEWLKKTSFLSWLPPALLVFQAGGHSLVIWGHNNLASSQLSLYMWASSLKSRPFYFLFYYYYFFCFFAFSRATPAAHGGSQARGLIGAVAAGLCQSHSNAGSEAASVTYTTAHGYTRPLTQWARPEIEPETSWFLVGFVNHWATTGTPSPGFERAAEGSCWLDLNLGSGTTTRLPPSFIQVWGVRPFSPFPRSWLAFSLFLQSHPLPAILLPVNIPLLSPFRLPLPNGVHRADSPLGFALNFSLPCVLGVLPWTPTMEVRVMSWQQTLTETHFPLSQTHPAHIGDRNAHCPSTCAPWQRGPCCFCPCPIG